MLMKLKQKKNKNYTRDKKNLTTTYILKLTHRPSILPGACPCCRWKPKKFKWKPVAAKMFVKEIRSGGLSREKGLLIMSPKECYHLNQTLEIWKELITNMEHLKIAIFILITSIYRVLMVLEYIAKIRKDLLDRRFF